jgi:hypothetical protein
MIMEALVVHLLTMHSFALAKQVCLALVRVCKLSNQHLHYNKEIKFQLSPSDQQTARLRHFLDKGTAMLWSIQYNRRGTAQARHLHSQ